MGFSGIIIIPSLSYMSFLATDPLVPVLTLIVMVTAGFVTVFACKLLMYDVDDGTDMEHHPLRTSRSKVRGCLKFGKELPNSSL